jgi:hypothetical protein
VSRLAVHQPVDRAGPPTSSRPSADLLAPGARMARRLSAPARAQQPERADARGIPSHNTRHTGTYNQQQQRHRLDGSGG